MGGSDGPAPTITAPASQAATSRATKPAKKDLDAYAALAERGMKSALGPSIKKVYSSIRIEPDYPSGLKYVYVFRKHISVAEGARYLDTQVPLLKASFRTQVAPEMKRHGFAHPSATWTYLNPDGSLIWTRTVPRPHSS